MQDSWGNFLIYQIKKDILKLWPKIEDYFTWPVNDHLAVKNGISWWNTIILNQNGIFGNFASKMISRTARTIFLAAGVKISIEISVKNFLIFENFRCKSNIFEPKTVDFDSKNFIIWLK